LYKTNPENAEALFAKAEEDAKKRMSFFEKLGPLM
jgi:pyruvate-ferredoxin/flavodoxin oxidoreductase